MSCIISITSGVEGIANIMFIHTYMLLMIPILMIPYIIFPILNDLTMIDHYYIILKIRNIDPERTYVKIEIIQTISNLLVHLDFLFILTWRHVWRRG